MNKWSAPEVFLDRVSKSLLECRVPTTEDLQVPELTDSDLRLRLTLFTDNIARLPQSVYRRLAVALNRDQIPSKIWLLERLSSVMDLQDSRVVVIGGWYGIFPLLLHSLYPSLRIRTDLVDLDSGACDVAATLLEGIVDDVTVTCKNASELDYRELHGEPNAVVVNTICEHMSDFADWFNLVQRGQRIALQSNDHRGCSEHTNCVASLEEFETQAPLSEIQFRGTLRLANFQRFMLIGCR